MRIRILALSLALLSAFPAQARSAQHDADITQRHFEQLVSGSETGRGPDLAGLTLFMTMMPKGGDLHHHYSGAIYAEQYLDWVARQNYCVLKASYRIETRAAVVAAERARPGGERNCLSAQEVIADNGFYRALLQRWSIKDYDFGALTPPDQHFFDTFGYFNPVASLNTNEGLLTLKQRAIDENLAYIETIFEPAPFISDPEFDRAALAGGNQDFAATLAAQAAALQQDSDFQRRIAAYVANVDASSAGVDDERFTMRYQAYVLRLLSPSQVFSAMLAGFQAASRSTLVVGVNIVGAENLHGSMRDYALHMRMFRFLKTQYPNVKLALHAGELAPGMVPPEGLRFHIRDAIEVAGANRIGHGIDLAHEADALTILKAMRERDIAVEINLTSNDFILGVSDQAHPLTLYRKHRVPFVISTDDAGVARNSLSGEYVLFASRYRTDYPELKKLSYASVRYSFLGEADKQRLKSLLDARFSTFEAAIAAAVLDAGRH